MNSATRPPIRFPYMIGTSELYGPIHRPSAMVFIRSQRNNWLPHVMLVDSGSDFTLVPKSVGELLGFRKESHDRVFRAGGIGGWIWVVKRRAEFKIGRHRFYADIGWAQTDQAPLLLGRADVFDRFDVRILNADRITELAWRGE